MAGPSSLKRQISPPPARKSARNDIALEREVVTNALPTLAAIEAGEARIRDHLAYFSEHLERVKRQTVNGHPRLGLKAFQDLYRRNQKAHGRHFVIHQHDHPVSGVHYDLRLQFSSSSTISFAVPYGLPGNPNSLRPNRMAIETRVHNLWNNLIESASHATGSLLIWDTGEYEVLPRHLHTKKAPETDDESSNLSEEDAAQGVQHGLSDSDKLFESFHHNHVRLRLHGTRLPTDYTIALRLTSANYKDTQPRKSRRKRRKKSVMKAVTGSPSISESESTAGTPEIPLDEVEDNDAAAAASDNDEDETIRLNNAYTGASNTIGSIHQRHWFMTLDRQSSGFVKASSGPKKGRWGRAILDNESRSGFDTFFVRGREVERSIVTGRLAQDIMDDDGVKSFMGRKMWRPITE